MSTQTLPHDAWVHIALFLQRRDMYRLMLAGSTDLCAVLHSDYLWAEVLWRDQKIRWGELSRCPSPLDVCQYLVRTGVHFIPTRCVHTTGGQFGAHYSPLHCLEATGTYCTSVGKDRDVEVTVAVDGKKGVPGCVAYVTHVVAAGAGYDFTAPLCDFSFAIGAKSVQGHLEQHGKTAVALPAPVPLSADETAVWTLVSSYSVGSNIDVRFLGLMGYWLPAGGGDDTENLSSSLSVLSGKASSCWQHLARDACLEYGALVSSQLFRTYAT